jgi:potassium-transporting ATPase potassium-binding subunit
VVVSPQRDWQGRFVFVIPLLAVAGSLAQKKKVPPSAGTLPTHGAPSAGLLVGAVLIMGSLAYFQALSVGPAIEHFAMTEART